MQGGAGRKDRAQRNWAALLLRSKGEKWLDPSNAPFAHMYGHGRQHGAISSSSRMQSLMSGSGRSRGGRGRRGRGRRGARGRARGGAMGGASSSSAAAATATATAATATMGVGRRLGELSVGGASGDRATDMATLLAGRSLGARGGMRGTRGTRGTRGMRGRMRMMRGGRGRGGAMMLGGSAPKPVAAGCHAGEAQYKPAAFVHVNKAGGTAMRAILFRHASHQMVERLAPEGSRYLRSLQPPARWFHASASLQRKAVGEARWRDAYTFGLVRNPYARQVSMFHFLLGEVSCARPIGQRPEHCELRKLPEPGPWLKDPRLAAPRFRK